MDRGVKLGDSQRDYNHATDSEYLRLRGLADAAYKKRNALSQQSQSAYKSGDKAEAARLSEQLKHALQEAENYSMQAAEYVFRENNGDSAGDEIDLHGLYVKEAKWILQKRIISAVRSHQSHLKVIVGKGLHSENGVAKLKPAMDEMCDEAGLTHRIDPKNAGVLVIDLSNVDESQLPSSWSAGPEMAMPQPAHQQSHQQGSHGQQQYQSNGQPQYQQQQQQNNGNNFKTGNQYVDMFIKIACICFKRM